MMCTSLLLAQSMDLPEVTKEESSIDVGLHDNDDSSLSVESEEESQPGTNGWGTTASSPIPSGNGSSTTITASAFVKKKPDAPSSSTENNTHNDHTGHHWFTTNSPTTEGNQEQRHHSPVLSHLPPEGFEISAHVVTNPNDGLSYFADNIPLTDSTDSSQSKFSSFPNAQIPYLQCGALGSTTSPISNIKHVTFRAFPKNANPTQFVPSTEVHLVVALSNLDIIVSGNGEEVRTFERGSVIFMEDLFGRGHKIRAAFMKQNMDNVNVVDGTSTTNDALAMADEDLSILILSLRGSNHHHYHYQSSSSATITDEQQKLYREQYYKALLGLKTMHTQYCTDETLMSGTTATPHHHPTSSEIEIDVNVDDDNVEDEGDVSNNMIQETQRTMIKIEDLIPSRRRVLLSSIGVGLSTITAVFLAKVAPLQLAVGVGGLCVIGGGTIGIVKGGEWICEEYDAYKEKEMIESNLQE